MVKVRAVRYRADSGRGTGQEKVVCVLLTDPADILEKKDNQVLNALQAAGVASAIGLYFYRFANQQLPFVKIGECTRPDGISRRFRNGWHSSETLTDSYWRKKRGGTYVDSEFLKQVRMITADNAAYFIFYQHRTIQSHPKIDEMYAYRQHKRLYGSDTLSPEKMNGNSMLGRSLVWHKGAFSEVARLHFPGGQEYPRVSERLVETK